MAEENNVYAFQAKDIKGHDLSLDQFRGKVMLIVNTASQCGFTYQYKGLEDLYEKYKGQGFVVLGFPCNQFGSQEPGDESEIANFCSLNYSVTFPLFAKIEVNGPDAVPLYNYLKKSMPGILGTENIKWNFTKFLIDRTGKPIDRFAPQTKPESLKEKIEELIQG